jgi:hypothetical protein
MTRNSLGISLLIVTPLAFVLKDVIATMAVLAAEPGISAEAARYYSLAMLPGPLFVESWVTVFNFIFGALVGLILYLCFRFKNVSLLIIPPSAFLLKDIIALATVVLVTEPDIGARGVSYYYIAMFPGSLLSKLGDPMVFNALFGALLGIVLYLRAVRRKDGHTAFIDDV